MKSIILMLKSVSVWKIFFENMLMGDKIIVLVHGLLMIVITLCSPLKRNAINPSGLSEGMVSVDLNIGM